MPGGTGPPQADPARAPRLPPAWRTGRRNGRRARIRRERTRARCGPWARRAVSANTPRAPSGPFGTSWDHPNQTGCSDARAHRDAHRCPARLRIARRAGRPGCPQAVCPSAESGSPQAPSPRPTTPSGSARRPDPERGRHPAGDLHRLRAPVDLGPFGSPRRALYSQPTQAGREGAGPEHDRGPAVWNHAVRHACGTAALLGRFLPRLRTALRGGLFSPGSL